VLVRRAFSPPTSTIMRASREISSIELVNVLSRELRIGQSPSRIRRGYGLFTVLSNFACFMKLLEFFAAEVPDDASGAFFLKIVAKTVDKYSIIL
jgi:hypothetical protein